MQLTAAQGDSAVLQVVHRADSVERLERAVAATEIDRFDEVVV
jgi:hypothetical protein